MKNKAVFLDRDGTINEEMGYINHISRFRVFPFVAEALKILQDCGYKLIIVTNQSGVARGYFNETLVQEVHRHLGEQMLAAGVKIDAVYYCPHHPSEGSAEYRRNCTCRKPNTGMIDRAVADFDIDLSRSFMIGDRFKDVQFARKVGLKAIMVLTGYGKGEYTFQRERWEAQPDYVCENLLDASRYIRDIVEKNNQQKK